MDPCYSTNMGTINDNNFQNNYGRGKHEICSHGNKELGTRSMEKQREMEFGFRKTATALIKPDR